MEQYSHVENGYMPLLIEEGWQAAVLNYDEQQALENITKLDVHYKTAEAFILLRGDCVLISAENADGAWRLKAAKMEPYIVYNIPKSVWHNIVMKPGSSVFIVEKDGTHLGDFEFFGFDSDMKSRFNKLVLAAFESNREVMG